jgi:hypothetical protein
VQRRRTSRNASWYVHSLPPARKRETKD